VTALFKRAYLTVTVAFFMTAAADAQTTVNFGITGAGPTGNNLAGVYTDPYAGCVGCTSGTPGTSVQIFCDDFTDDVSPPEYWQAFATNISAFTASGNVATVYYSATTTPSGAPVPPGNPSTTPTTYAGLPTGLVSGWGVAQESQPFSQTTDYIAAAILAAESITAGSGNPTAQNDLSFALWGIFDPTLLDNAQNQYGTLPTGSPWNDLAAAQTDLESALLQASTYSNGTIFTEQTGINATIYTACTNCAVGPTATGAVDTTPRPQEFIVVAMPEPATPVVLGFYLVAVAVMGLVFRLRRGRVRP